MIASIVLASASSARRTMLTHAGVSFSVDAAAIDEDALKTMLRAGGAGAETVAAALALAKAETIAARHPGALVIGSDQILSCGERWFDKPENREAAKEQLLALRGRTHELIAAAVVVSNGDCLWRHVERAELVMWPFSERFVDGYLDRIGAAALQSVGAYQIEGLGVQLFEAVRGDLFTIMGMPLLPLLAFLRSRGAVAA
jgi:septum formation protein